jgi:hypothetical protein
MPGMDAGGYSESVNLQKVEEKRYDGDEGPFTKQEFFEVRNRVTPFDLTLYSIITHKSPQRQSCHPCSFSTGIWRL